MPVIHCAFIAHPPLHIVQCENAVTIGPCESFGVSDQFCVQIEESSSSFQGSGENMIPRIPPPVNLRISLRVIIFDIKFFRFDFNEFTFHFYGELHRLSTCDMQRIRHGGHYPRGSERIYPFSSLPI